MYDPTLGRFLQRDPLGFADGANVYPYALSNPARVLDPLGENGQLKPLVKSVHDLPTSLEVPREGWFGRSRLWNIRNKWRGCGSEFPTRTCQEVRTNETVTYAVYEFEGRYTTASYYTRRSGIAMPWWLGGNWGVKWQFIVDLYVLNVYKKYDVTFRRIDCLCGGGICGFFAHNYSFWVVEKIGSPSTETEVLEKRTFTLPMSLGTLEVYERARAAEEELAREWAVEKGRSLTWPP